MKMPAVCLNEMTFSFLGVARSEEFLVVEGNNFRSAVKFCVSSAAGLGRSAEVSAGDIRLLC